MSLAADYVVAHRNHAPAVLAGGSGTQPDARLAGIDPPRLASLLVILARHKRPYLGPARCKMLTDSAHHQCVLLVPPRMVAMLAAAEAVAPQVAVEWARAHGPTSGAWSVQAASQALGRLIELAKMARRSDSDLLVRLSLSPHT
jgi:hypothetical protein